MREMPHSLLMTRMQHQVDASVFIAAVLDQNKKIIEQGFFSSLERADDWILKKKMEYKDKYGDNYKFWYSFKSSVNSTD